MKKKKKKTCRLLPTRIHRHTICGSFHSFISFSFFLNQILPVTQRNTKKKEIYPTDWYHRAFDCQFAFLIKQCLMWEAHTDTAAQLQLDIALYNPVLLISFWFGFIAIAAAASAIAYINCCWPIWVLGQMRSLWCWGVTFYFLSFLSLSLRLSFWCFPTSIQTERYIYVINIIIVITQVSAVRADEGAAGAYLMTSLVHLPSCILWLLFLYSSRCLFSSPKVYSTSTCVLCVLFRVFFL